MKRPAIVLPDGLLEREEGRVLLHACCAPCSSAIVEWMVNHELKPAIFYYNPNIFPHEEYEIRKQESKRHAESLGLGWIDGDYDHDGWRQDVCGLEGEPERGRRCELCFTLRLTRTAQKAKELGIRYFTTTSLGGTSGGWYDVLGPELAQGRIAGSPQPVAEGISVLQPAVLRL